MRCARVPAVTGSVAVAVYRSGIADTAPAGIPAAAEEAARDTVGGAAKAAESLPQDVGEQLLTAAREAFTSGFHATAWVSAGMAVLTAVVALVLLRHIPAIGAAPDAAPESGEPTAGPASAASAAAREEPVTSA